MSEDNDNWMEKYRPKNLSQLIGHGKTLDTIKSWIIDFKNHVPGTKNCLLLHGPPGVGKTSMANIILNHYNYDVIEFNASDIRNQKMVQEKLNQSMNKVNIIQLMISKPKMVGIIMDEVDGMSGGEKGGISELINLIELNNKDSKKKLAPNHTPIICICNDLSDKKLKELKKKALIVKIAKPSKILLQKLALRLVEQENIPNLDDINISYIINKSQGDYRRLVSIMQYLFRYSGEDYLDADLQQEYIIKHLKYFDNKNIDITVYESTDKLLNNYTNLQQALSLYNIDRNIISMLLYENFLNTIVNNRKDTNQVKINIMSKIYYNFSIGDIIDYDIYINQQWLLNDINGVIKCAETSYLLNNMKKYTYNKDTNLKFSSLLNKSSLEYLNYKNLSKLNYTLGIYNTENLYKDTFDLILKYLFHSNDEICKKGVGLLKNYKLNVDDIDKLIKHSNIYQKKLYTTKIKKKIKEFYDKSNNITYI